jgi:hypothetical protein
MKENKIYVELSTKIFSLCLLIIGIIVVSLCADIVDSGNIADSKHLEINGYGGRNQNGSIKQDLVYDKNRDES